MLSSEGHTWVVQIFPREIDCVPNSVKVTFVPLAFKGSWLDVFGDEVIYPYTAIAEARFRNDAHHECNCQDVRDKTYIFERTSDE